jgi:hypothetical protein
LGRSHAEGAQVKRGPKPRNYKTVVFRGNIPESLDEKVEALLPTSSRTKEIHRGERSKLLIRLLTRFVKESEEKVGLSDLLGPDDSESGSISTGGNPSNVHRAGAFRLARNDLAIGQVWGRGELHRTILGLDGAHVHWQTTIGEVTLEKTSTLGSFSVWVVDAELQA